MNVTLLRFDVLDSTNTEAARHARAGVDEGLSVLARRQTAGRGRRGRTWLSEEDAGLYFSIVLRPRLAPQLITLITLMAGVAVHETLAGTGVTADIKWVNDLLVGDKKIGGILAEAVETPQGLSWILGIVVNLRLPATRPAGLREYATSVADACGTAITADEFAARLTPELTRFYEFLHTGNGPDGIIAEWGRRSGYFRGKAVRVHTEAGTIDGITDGLEPNGALRLRTQDGEITVIQAGDVERLRKAAD